HARSEQCVEITRRLRREPLEPPQAVQGLARHDQDALSVFLDHGDPPLPATLRKTGGPPPHRIQRSAVPPPDLRPSTRPRPILLTSDGHPIHLSSLCPESRSRRSGAISARPPDRDLDSGQE